MADSVCTGAEKFGSVCKGLPANNVHEGKQYCVLHFPSVDKDLAAFEEAIEKKLRAKDCDLRGVYFPREADFSEATFEGDADFSEATFKKRAGFSRATFKERAGFARLVRGATFEAEADFSGATFEDVAAFYPATFQAEAKFSAATFEGDVVFSEATFEGWAYFSAVTFEAEATFSRATFEGGTAGFRQATFKKKADFSRATFEGGTPDFSAVTFKKKADFPNATFKKRAFFSRATFEGDVDFTGAIFEDLVLFFEALFKKRATFYFAIFKEGAMFRSLRPSPQASLVFQAVVAEKPERVSFHTTPLRPSYFIDVDSQKFDFLDVQWFSAPSGDELKLGDEIEALEKAWDDIKPRLQTLRTLQKSCRQLMNNAEENRDYPTANEFHYWSMLLARKEAMVLAREKGLREGLRRFGLVDALYGALSGYGDRPWRASLVLLGMWAVFVLLYLVTGSIEHVGQALLYSLAAIVRLTGIPAMAQLTKLLHPSEPGLFQFLVTAEGILGPLQIALLALAVRRKVMR